MEKIRTIIWDLDETVWFYNENEIAFLCKKLNIEQKEQFKNEYYKMWSNLLVDFLGKIVTYDKVKKFIEEQMPLLRLHKISVDIFLEILAEEKKNIATVNEEAVEMLKYFFHIGLRNISVTDWFAKDQEKALTDFGVIGYIDKVYGCDNVYFKNSPEKIPQIIAELKLEGRKEEVVMIGDSLTSDIFFAKRLGIKSIWYNPKGKKNDTDIIPDLEVKSLLELKNVF